MTAHIWHGTGTSINSGGVKLVLLAKPPLVVKWCGHATVFHMFVKYQPSQWVRSLDLTAHASLSPIRGGFAPSFVNNKKRCTRLAAASDKVYQLFAHGRWFSPGTPASSATKTGRHDIAEILLKVALKHQKSIQKNQINPHK